MTTNAHCPSLSDTRTEQVENALAEARDLKAWWDKLDWWRQSNAGATSVERFELFPASPENDATWGFFGKASVRGREVPVMGNVGEYFFDCPESVAPDNHERSGEQARVAQFMADQVREFVLGYWLRAMAQTLPQPYPDLGRLEPPPFLRGLNLAPPANPELSGMGNLQRLFKKKNGETGKFPADQAKAIIDLNELNTEYQWITLDRSLLNFDLTLKAGPVSLRVPLHTVMHLILSSDLMVNTQENPEPDTLGEFGIGCALMKDPESGPIAFGPDKIQPGFELFSLRVLKTGKVRLRIVTIMGRPDKILNLSIDPIDWSGKAADRLTLRAAQSFTDTVRIALGQGSGDGLRFDPLFGPARLIESLVGGGMASEFGISRERIEKVVLTQDSAGLRDSLLSTRLTWMQITDWTNRADIDKWIENDEIVFTTKKGEGK